MLELHDRPRALPHLGSGAGAPEQSVSDLPPLNRRVRDFAAGKTGQQVGDGECWALAYEALDAANARRPGQDGLEVCQFGTVVDLGAVVPGDVLQFQDANFRHTDPDGSWYGDSFPSRTAIVSAVSSTRITLFDQHVNGNRTVQLSTIDLKDCLPGGTITAYRPAPR